MSEKKIVLAIETSTKKGSISILSEDQETAIYQLADDEPVSEFLLIKIKELLIQNNLTLANIKLIAVSLGPGSLTGLRIGIAIGQGLANSLGVSCVGVSVFEAMKESQSTENGFYISSAGNKKFYWQTHQSEIKIGTLDDILKDKDYEQQLTFFITKDASDNVNTIQTLLIDSREVFVIENLVELVGKVAIEKEEQRLENSLTPVYIGETGFKKMVL